MQMKLHKIYTWSMLPYSNDAFFAGRYEGRSMSAEGGRAGEKRVRQGLWKIKEMKK